MIVDYGQNWFLNFLLKLSIKMWADDGAWVAPRSQLFYVPLAS